MHTDDMVLFSEAAIAQLYSKGANNVNTIMDHPCTVAAHGMRMNNVGHRVSQYL